MQKGNKEVLKQVKGTRKQANEQENNTSQISRKKLNTPNQLDIGNTGHRISK